jgi:DNA-binding NtrC family response regulator
MNKHSAMLGLSAAIRGVEEDIEYAARSLAKVLISGESGVGKEIVARVIHERSSRREGPLVTVNCAGIPDSLLESELFGHVKGSFTDAHRDAIGLLERARNGTIFLDEVGEMSSRMQALLLRFLETGEIQRVGADRLVSSVDVRVIAATNRRLMTLVEESRFREDLYYRLNVIHIEVPPLRERREDVPVLLGHFLRLFSQSHGVAAPVVSAQAIEVLAKYDWPGNVRELRNIAERLVLRHSDGQVDVSSLPEEILYAARRPAMAAPSAAVSATPKALFDAIVHERRSFWTVAYEPFMARDLTRNDIRDLIRLGLERTKGNYRALVATFNMPPDDYKKLLNFLRKYQCHVPFQGFRMAQANLDTTTSKRNSAKVAS